MSLLMKTSVKIVNVRDIAKKVVKCFHFNRLLSFGTKNLFLMFPKAHNTEVCKVNPGVFSGVPFSPI